MSGRRSHSAQADIISILAWSHDQFGEQARERYEALIATAIRDVATRGDEGGRTVRHEGPRHLLICRREDDILVVGRSSTTQRNCDDTSIPSSLGLVAARRSCERSTSRWWRSRWLRAARPRANLD